MPEMEVFIDYLIHIVLPVLILTFLILIVILITNRLYFEVFKFRYKLAKAKTDIFLTSLVFSPLDEVGFAIEINRFKKRIPFNKNWCKDIILNKIITLKKSLKGETTRNIHFIYEQFDLFNFSIAHLKSNRWYIKSQAIYHFQSLEYSKGEPYVKPYLNDKNKMLSSNAYIGFISLTKNNLDFLCDYPNPISFTSQIKVMDILHSKKPVMPRNLKDWIQAKNPSIVKLGIKFMVFYNATDEADNIIKLLQSEDESIRFEVIASAKDLFISGAEQILITQFGSEQKKNKIEILKTLAVIGSEFSLNFITELLSQNGDLDIQLEAVYTAVKINPDYFDNSFKNNSKVTKMIKHVKDPYI